MKRALRAMAILLLTLSAGPALSAPFYGIAKAKDGDSLMVGDREVRLFGIDAPEFDQTCKRNGQNWSCGSEAADQLDRLVTGRDVRCVGISTDEYQRAVARCSVGGTDINAAMVERGYAVAYRHYSADYVPFEERAKAARRGIWSGTFIMPSELRRIEHAGSRPQRRRPDTGAPRREWSNRSACNIKGNRNQRGQWIYHVPGMPYYEQTRAEEFFCSEGEAQAAGYRRAVVK